MRIEIFHNPEEKTNWNGLYSDQLINAIKTHFEVKNNQNKSLDVSDLVKDKKKQKLLYFDLYFILENCW